MVHSIVFDGCGSQARLGRPAGEMFVDLQFQGDSEMVACTCKGENRNKGPDEDTAKPRDSLRGESLERMRALQHLIS
jgi:hypothetical protein